jgi:hypothetical protein
MKKKIKEYFIGAQDLFREDSYLYPSEKVSGNGVILGLCLMPVVAAVVAVYWSWRAVRFPFDLIAKIINL